MATVTKVVLSDRSRARYEAEADQQRAQKPHDIRSAIPMVDYTNPAKFPPYKFREYPKMPLLDNNLPIVIDEAGGVLVFYDAADEVEFKDNNPEIADEIERNAPAKALADRLSDQEAELDNLRTMLKNAGIAPPEKAKARSRNAVAAATNGEPGEDDDSSTSLRDTVKKAEAGNPLHKKKN